MPENQSSPAANRTGVISIIKVLQHYGAKDLEKIFKENTLTDDDFVFWMSQGCMFCFFKLSEGDNPPVYFYNESGEDRFIKIADTLVGFLINRLEMNKELFKEKV